MKLPVRTALTHKLVVAAAVALLASGAAMGAFAAQDKLPGQTHHVTSTQIEPTSTSTATATSTANPNDQGTPRAIKGIPTDNPQHHPEDGDGACDTGETAIKTTTSGVTIPTLPLNRLGRLSSADFSIVLPGAVANALLNDSHTRILQNPTARVTDGFTVKLRIGSRFPYATGSFLPSFGGGLTGGTGGGTAGGAAGFGLLASTQFNYQDVGVNLDLTPHLLSNGEVALHALIEISSVGQTVTIGGLQEPSFGQRRIEHDIRLKEGEVNLLGGLIESTTSRSVSGLPGLSQIPGLRYFFSNEHSERIDTEVLVMLTPRVIRLPEPSIASERSTPLSGGSPIQEFIPQPEMPPQPPGQIQ